MTTVRVLTPAGRGAVATLLIEGDLRILDRPSPLFQAARGGPVGELPLGRATFGGWGESSPEEVVLCRIGHEAVEIHCHGGAAAASRIADDLAARGCEVGDVPSGQRNGEDLLDCECREAVTRATTLRTADILLQQQQTLLRQAYVSLRDGEPSEAKGRVEELLRWGEFGIHLTEPWRVVLCGRPNVGKSSLINALLGFSRAIVFDQPGTTRDVVNAETALDGWPVTLSDTAGLRDQADDLETQGIARARRTIAAADVRVLLIDSSQPPDPEDRRLLAQWPDALVVAHKSDLPSMWGDEVPPAALAVSSLTRTGVERLVESIVWRIVPEVPDPMSPMPVTRRQVSLLEEIRQRIVAGASSETVRRQIETLVSG